MWWSQPGLIGQGMSKGSPRPTWLVDLSSRVESMRSTSQLAAATASPFCRAKIHALKVVERPREKTKKVHRSTINTPTVNPITTTTPLFRLMTNLISTIYHAPTLEIQFPISIPSTDKQNSVTHQTFILSDFLSDPSPNKIPSFQLSISMLLSDPSTSKFFFLSIT